MSKIVSAALLAATLNARYPNAGGHVESISASAGKVENVEASAVRGFTAPSGSLQYVKATEAFYQEGELINVNDFVQVSEVDARNLERMGRATFATDAEVAEAQKAAA